jgi:putative ABC transport system permease protein
MEGLVSLVRFLVSQLRFRSARALTLGAGILVAAVSFTLLTSAATTSRLQVQSTVSRNFRGAYDILVRPAGSYAPLEREAGLVRQNYLGGIFGGISLRQYEDVKRIPDVAVAAPIANLGYVAPIHSLPVTIDRTLTRDPVQLYRLRHDWLANNRLSRYEGGSDYVYYTRTGRFVEVEGFPNEVLPDGSRAQVCNPEATMPEGSHRACFSQRSPQAARLAGLPAGRGGRADLHTPILLAAVDPEQEARLVRLDQAMVAGRYLRGGDDDAVAPPGGMRLRTVPILASSRLYLDQVLETSVERLEVPRGVDVPAVLSSPRAGRFLSSLRGRVVQRQVLSPVPIYERALERYSSPSPDAGSLLTAYWSVTPVGYRSLGPDHLAPVPTVGSGDVWKLAFSGRVRLPGSDDVQYRTVRLHEGSTEVDLAEVVRAPAMRIVGRFDPERLPGFSPLSRVPLETYYPPQVRPADAAGRRALDGRPLRPTTNIGGYLAQPPLLLTTIKALDVLTDPTAYRAANQAAPVSVIRIRVAGVSGPDKVSRERIRRVAAAIVARTGLAVDVTAGSSPHQLLVDLPAGRHGQPPLRVSEDWVRKGAAIVILEALDRKSVALFFLVLLTCACFVANGAFAAVRARRAEIGTLRCLGWSAGSSA